MLYYDPRDEALAARRNDRRLEWLDDLGALPLSEAKSNAEGFVFAGARSMEDYAAMMARCPKVRDLPGERGPLLELHTVLERVPADVPTPRTWLLPLDAELPGDLTYPLFVRTTRSSWKLGGQISKVQTARQLAEEAAELRRALGWDALILAREWLNLAPAGQSTYGPVPQEVRVWIVDGRPHAWSFHYLNVVALPAGFPPGAEDLGTLAKLAGRVAAGFGSRLIVADFAKTTAGKWVFIEAGPGSAAGTGHEGVFRSVALALDKRSGPAVSTVTGGTF